MHAMTAQQFNVVKSHGWVQPPDDGYGEKTGDHPLAQERVQVNHMAMKRAMRDLHDVKYNHNDKESRLFMEDMKSGALQASEATHVADLENKPYSEDLNGQSVTRQHKQQFRKITGQDYDETDPKSRGWMTDMIERKASAGYNAVKSGAKSAGKMAHAAKEHVKAKVHKMTAPQFDVVKSHGWLPPPPEGYGEDADDDLTAQERVQVNHVAMKRAMMDLHDVKYNHNDKESRLFMESGASSFRGEPSCRSGRNSSA